MIGGDHPVWAVTADLLPAERLVLVCMAAHAGEDGRCWPSVARLMSLTGYSERSVRGSLTSLRSRGFIKVVEWRYSSETSTVHELSLPPAVDCTGVEDPPAVGCTGPLQPTAPAPLQKSTGPPCSPLHPEEPKKNQRKDQKKNHVAVVVAEVVDIGTRNGTPVFADFWDIWPRKVAKRAAEKAWTAACRRAPADHVLDGARRYASGPLPEPQYIPHPATWLNGDRWDDTPADVAPRHEPKSFAAIRRVMSEYPK